MNKPKRMFREHRKLDSLDPRCIAFHEAGHAVVAVRLGLPLQYVTIKRVVYADGTSMGHCHYGDLDRGKYCGAGGALMPYIVQCLAGPLAEFTLRADPDIFGGSGKKDYEEAFALAALALYDGPKSAPEVTVNASDPKYKQVVDQAFQEAQRLVGINGPTIAKVAALLQKRGRLTGDEVEAVSAS